MDALSFRALFHDLEDYEGDDAYHAVLLPWHGHAVQAMEILRPYGQPMPGHWTEYTAKTSLQDEHDLNLWELYALSRVSDLLIAPFQPIGDEATFAFFREPWIGPSVSLEERTQWFQSLGMRLIETTMFHPFYHEIVTVEQSPDPAEPIMLVETLWPGFMLGQMLFCRAGVTVRGGRDWINKQIAETSTLFWTYRRNNRPTSDLSHGWGHNSQWSTRFRRDYADAMTFYYNVDGEAPADDYAFWDSSGWEGVNLTREEAIELLRNRCRIVTDKPDNGLSPFPDTYVEAKPHQ